MRLLFILTFCLIPSICTVVCGADAGKAADWPQWRGPKRDDVSTESGLLKEWPGNGPKLLWESQGAGRGYASVAIAAGRIITMGDSSSLTDDKDEYVLCFTEDSGKPVWKAKVGSAWNEGRADWQSSRSTPTIDGDHVYALSAQGTLLCLATVTGKEVWRKDLKKDFDGKKGDGWGYSESILIDGEKLICTPGGEAHTLLALNKRTGEKIWSTSSPGDPGAGHSSAVVAEIGGTRVYVQATASGPLCVRASDGVLQWTFPVERITAVIPTPIVRGDLLFFVAGYGPGGGALLRQVADGDKVKVETIYPLKGDLKNKHGGVVLVGDYLYGDSDANGIPYCADLMTGQVKWKKRGSGSGSAAVTYADGHLYIRYENGTMTLVEASPTDLKEVGSFKIPHRGGRPSWSHPVVTGGKLFLREGDYLLCYDLRKS